jgi:hypothetical protein
VVQAGAALKWTAHLATGVRTGEASNGPLAIIRALKAIDRDAQQIRAARSKAEREKLP